MTFAFTAFAAADLFGGGRAREAAGFEMPAAPTIAIAVVDDDPALSGDARRNERGDDRSGQTATVTRDGDEIGSGGRLYAEQIWQVEGADGVHYRLAELEQAGGPMGLLTFVGAVPPAGTGLTLRHPVNVSGAGIAYDELGAGDASAPAAPNIVEIAAGSDDFGILVQALATAGLVETIRDATDITVFAPTDAAFAALAADLGYDGDPGDEAAVFGFIAAQLTELGGGDPIPLLTDILTYHVSPGAQAADELGTVATLQGATFDAQDGELVDREPDVANPTIVAADIAASNGVVQVIDRVLLPIDIPGNAPPAPELPTLAGIVAASGGTFDADGGDFDLLLQAVQAADLAGALDDPAADLTVFAPTDAAFVGLARALGFDGTDEGAAFAYLVEALTLLGGGDPIPLLTEVLIYHVAPGRLDAAAVLSADAIPTLQGGALGVDGTTLVDAEPDLPNPGIVATDIAAANGIAHVVDGVLLPADLPSGGNVDLVIGDDGGELIFTRGGDDLIDGNGGGDVILAGEGDDLVLGGDGADYVRGGRGDDTIAGGAGDDKLIGGRGTDVFVFAAGDGNDRVLWFEDGIDVLDLRATGATGFADLAIHEAGNRALIRVDADQMILVRGQGLDLGEDDFLF